MTMWSHCIKSINRHLPTGTKLFIILSSQLPKMVRLTFTFSFFYISLSKIPQQHRKKSSIQKVNAQQTSLSSLNSTLVFQTALRAGHHTEQKYFFLLFFEVEGVTHTVSQRLHSRLFTGTSLLVKNNIYSALHQGQTQKPTQISVWWHSFPPPKKTSPHTNQIHPAV